MVGAAQCKCILYILSVRAHHCSSGRAYHITSCFTALQENGTLKYVMAVWQPSRVNCLVSCIVATYCTWQPTMYVSCCVAKPIMPSSQPPPLAIVYSIQVHAMAHPAIHLGNILLLPMSVVL